MSEESGEMEESDRSNQSDSSSSNEAGFSDDESSYNSGEKGVKDRRH